ncbi:MAG: alpha/beta fold hydrolase [Candidatus Brockarchaeota archaeon]|nr:alpha/beta fold hydrolase [Candidatus Brockarchaeota archaeon]
MYEYAEAAKPFLIGHGRNAVLLIHGFTGLPHEMREYGEYLASRGFRVYAPLLPGHGSCKEDMIKTGRADWIRGVEEGLKLLWDEGIENVFVSGLSMGGTLTLYVGETHPEVKGLLPVCGPVYLSDWRLRFLLPIVRRFTDYYSENLSDILDKSVLENPVAREHRRRYDKVPLPCVAELLELIRETRERLSMVKQPILIAQARRDRVVPPGNAEYIYRSVSSTVKRVLWLENSGHVATMDFDKHILFKEAVDFFNSIIL